jgi:hypothetical protein
MEDEETRLNFSRRPPRERSKLRSAPANRIETFAYKFATQGTRYYMGDFFNYHSVQLPLLISLIVGCVRF